MMGVELRKQADEVIANRPDGLTSYAATRLFILCDRVSDRTSTLTASAETIGRWLGVSERSARQFLAVLEDVGIIVRLNPEYRGGGTGLTATYRLFPEAATHRGNVRPIAAAGRQQVDETEEQRTPHPVTREDRVRQVFDAGFVDVHAAAMEKRRRDENRGAAS